MPAPQVLKPCPSVSPEIFPPHSCNETHYLRPPHLVHRWQLLLTQRHLKSHIHHCLKHQGDWSTGPPSPDRKSTGQTNIPCPCFQLTQGQSLNLYTDSKYAFYILLSHSHLDGAWTTANKGRINSQLLSNHGHVKDLSSPHGHRNCPLPRTNSSIISLRKIIQPMRQQEPQTLEAQIHLTHHKTISPYNPHLHLFPDTQQILSYIPQLFHPNCKVYFNSLRPMYNPPLRIWLP